MIRQPPTRTPSTQLSSNETGLDGGAPGRRCIESRFRRGSWAADLKSSLVPLRDAMTDERHELERPGSLLAMISAERPRRFGPRVRGIRMQYDDIVRQLESFQRDSNTGMARWAMSATSAIADWIIRALHNCRNRQADLVFEALELDLGDRHQ